MGQIEAVKKSYEAIADEYDTEFEAKAEYAAPQYITEVFEEFDIRDGSILDIGCGTGKLREYLGKNFQYVGIDISPKMLSIAKNRGYETHEGDAIEQLQTLGDKSVDHIVALSSLYFIEDFHAFISECERVARRSLFITLEQFDQRITEMMKTRGIDLYNHDLSIITNPTKIFGDVYLWKRPKTEDRIFGDVVFKKVE